MEKPKSASGAPKGRPPGTPKGLSLPMSSARSKSPSSFGKSPRGPSPPRPSTPQGGSSLERRASTPRGNSPERRASSSPNPRGKSPRGKPSALPSSPTPPKPAGSGSGAPELSSRSPPVLSAGRPAAAAKAPASGWVSVGGEGAENLQLVGGGLHVVASAKPLLVRTGSDKGSESCGYLAPGTNVKVLEYGESSDGTKRVHVSSAVSAAQADDRAAHG